MVLVSPELKARLREKGVSTLHAGPFGLPDDSIFEPPCSLKWMGAHHSLRLGAFSYAVSGYYFAASIGRYTSIGESVQVGRGSHPVSWASTSPLFYQPHTTVLDVPVPDAAEYRFAAPNLGIKPTIIGNDVYIGHGAFLMQGVTVGDGTVVGACSVVTKDVPPYAVVAGSPATVRRMRFPEPIIERMSKIRWWQYAFWDLSDIPFAEPTAFLDFVELRQQQGLEPYKPQLVSIKELLRGETAGNKPQSPARPVSPAPQADADIVEAVLPISNKETVRQHADRAVMCLESLNFFWRDRAHPLVVHVVTPDQEQDSIRSVLRPVAEASRNLRFAFRTDSSISPHLSSFPRQGTGKQMIIKLAAYRFVRSRFFLTLDTDVVACKPFDSGDLVSGGRALMDRIVPSTSNWWQQSAMILGVEARLGKPRMFVTPQLLSIDICEQLAAFLTSRFSGGDYSRQFDSWDPTATLSGEKPGYFLVLQSITAAQLAFDRLRSRWLDFVRARYPGYPLTTQADEASP
ncbi:MAG TPA: DUF6492 family protein [Acetobacteraceae bacterium]|nr:DUF6492 family protein [Acetobacteraceae bacterium]